MLNLEGPISEFEVCMMTHEGNDQTDQSVECMDKMGGALFMATIPRFHGDQW
jgi:hypothetical protein